MLWLINSFANFKEYFSLSLSLFYRQVNLFSPGVMKNRLATSLKIFVETWLKLQVWQFINTSFITSLAIILIYSLAVRLMMVFSSRKSSSYNKKSSQADNCHIFFLALILIFNIIVLYPDGWVLISLHHIDEYKLLLTLSDVDSFSFYVFCRSFFWGRGNRCKSS